MHKEGVSGKPVVVISPAGPMVNSTLLPVSHCQDPGGILPERYTASWFDEPQTGVHEAEVRTNGPAIRRSVSPRSAIHDLLRLPRSVCVRYPLKVTTERPQSRTMPPSAARAGAWQKGSPPENVTPSSLWSERILSASSSTPKSVFFRNDQSGRLKHPGHRRGHPWTQRTARSPGPFTRDLSRKPAQLTIIPASPENPGRGHPVNFRRALFRIYERRGFLPAWYKSFPLQPYFPEKVLRWYYLCIALRDGRVPPRAG